jgi:BirA family biotin operon repressor/biotin-[acetyl-CoA-carboxylase] ligase
MVASLAIQDTVSEMTEMQAAIKWPNDVLLENKKVSGVLIETILSSAKKVDFAVMGIGLNVNLNPVEMEGIKQSATSIRNISGTPTDKYKVLSKLLRHIDQRYQLVLEGEDLCIDWSSRVSTIGNKVKVSNGSKIISGYAVALDSIGNLIVQTKREKVTVTAGDVTLI